MAKRGDLIKDAQKGVPVSLIRTPTNVGGLGRKAGGKTSPVKRGK